MKMLWVVEASIWIGLFHKRDTTQSSVRVVRSTIAREDYRLASTQTSLQTLSTGGVEQRGLARRAHDPEVSGSTPLPA